MLYFSINECQRTNNFIESGWVLVFKGNCSSRLLVQRVFDECQLNSCKYKLNTDGDDNNTHSQTRRRFRDATKYFIKYKSNSKESPTTISSTFILICVSCMVIRRRRVGQLLCLVNIHHKQSTLRICGGALNAIDNLISGEGD